MARPTCHHAAVTHSAIQTITAKCNPIARGEKYFDFTETLYRARPRSRLAVLRCTNATNDDDAVFVATLELVASRDYSLNSFNWRGSSLLVRSEERRGGRE